MKKIPEIGFCKEDKRENENEKKALQKKKLFVKRSVELMLIFIKFLNRAHEEITSTQGQAKAKRALKADHEGSIEGGEVLT